MIRALLILLALALPAQAQSARILSGEHGDFTRLVVELPSGAEWSVGRTASGYAFAAKGRSQPDYDISTVWDRIARTRLADLSIDATSGTLMLTLGCDCHVFPFEYSPGIVVLDIKDGPAPEGSVFEAAFPSAMAAPATSGNLAGYDWLADRPTRPATEPTLPLPLDTGAVSLTPLRDELLEQIAKGAADGVVDMELPGKPPKVSAVDHDDLPWSHIRIGEDPGVTVTTPGALIAEDIVPSSCADPALLDLPSWGSDQSPQDLLVAARSGLYGEFDRPDEAAILRSAQQLLYLGFGVEARQHLDMLGPTASDQSLPLYRSMSHLVDGESDPKTPFAGMLECDGPAALWAALAHDRIPAGPGVNRDAILQSYLALPAHLRRHLGPSLAEKFLALGDLEGVRIIRDAVERAPNADPGSVALLDAKTSLQEGDAEAALLHAEAAVALDGDRADNLVALVETHFLKLQPMDPEIAEALLSVRGETDAEDARKAVDRAIVLALALSNQTARAFEADPAPPVLSELWQVVGARAEDDDFLRHAVISPDAPPPDVAPKVARATADRLLRLGFPDAALAWLGPVTLADPLDLRLTAAAAQIARRDAAAALAVLDGTDGPEAAALRAEALLLLGDLSAAQDALATAGDGDAAARVGVWDGDWSGLAPEKAASWQETADLARPLPDGGTAGLLDRGNRTVEASLAARDAIQALLAGVETPTGN